MAHLTVSRRESSRNSSGVLGSVSLPFSSGDDSLVKVASETISSEVFYDRFFALVRNYLDVDEPTDPTPPLAGTAKQ